MCPCVFFLLLMDFLWNLFQMLRVCISPLLLHSPDVVHFEKKRERERKQNRNRKNQIALWPSCNACYWFLFFGSIFNAFSRIYLTFSRRQVEQFGGKATIWRWTFHNETFYIESMSLLTYLSWPRMIAVLRICWLFVLVFTRKFEFDEFRIRKSIIVVV